jgi:phospholipid/cholesterol/gamma-HCH transport system ATP-binding protein
LKPDQGKIWVEQDEITHFDESHLSRVRREMGFLFQDAALFDSLTVYQDLKVFRVTRRPALEDRALFWSVASEFPRSRESAM